MGTSTLKTAIGSVKHWYIPLIIGLLLIVMGISVFATPLASYLTLSALFSVSFLISGILQIIFSLANRREMDSWGWHLVGGILYTLFGLLLINRPEISITTLPFVVGFFVLFASANALAWAYDLRKMGSASWGSIAALGVLGMLFSFILLWNPLFAGLSLVIWTGMAFVFAGIAAIMLSIQLKKVKDVPAKVSEELRRRYDSIRKEYHEALSR